MNLQTGDLPREEWIEYFQRLAPHIASQEVQVEALGEEIGDQIDLPWERLRELSFSPERDEIRIGSARRGELIRQPRKIFVQEERGLIRSIEIIDASSVRYILHFREGLLLPGPGSRAANY